MFYVESDTSSADITGYYVVFADDKLFISGDAIAAEVDPLDDTLGQIYFGDPTTASQALAMDASSGYQGAGWYQSVPEPTSGLLMLLGMAGLALRRRRA